MTKPERFIILDPRKDKRRAVQATLAPLGALNWWRTPRFGMAITPQARKAAETASTMSKSRGWSDLRSRLTTHLLAHQYTGTRAFFDTNPDAVAVCWNGLNGSRHVFMQAAKDAGARCLFYELAPLAGRITIDPRGVNALNSLPRDAAPYVAWSKTARDPSRSWRTLADAVRQRPATQARTTSPDAPPLDDPFVLVALQTPGDSQLRLFGGAFKTVEGFAKACIDAAAHLPQGWHMRIKEHPTAPTDLSALLATHGNGRAFLDNATDTFAQVAASRAVITVNSSVGLEAMMFDKPVVACGECFWAIDGIANSASTPDALATVCAQADTLGYDQTARDAFLDYLDQVYYPPRNGAPELIAARLSGKDAHGFWDAS